VIEKEKPGYYDVNEKHTSKRTSEFTIYKDKKSVRRDVEMGIDKQDKDLGPQSYDTHGSFLST
jgi:hypothetical protein